MEPTSWERTGSSMEKGPVYNPRFVIPAQNVPLMPPIDVSVPPPPFPLIQGPNPLTSPPPLNVILPGGPPPLPVNRFINPTAGIASTPKTLVPPKPPPPLLLVRHNEKYIMKFNNCELLPQYLIEEDIWHRFGVLSCSVVIQRNHDTGAPITDDEVQIHFNELATAEAAFKELISDEKYCDLQFHEECIPLVYIKRIQ